jgi:hypothetical protein
VRRLNRQTKTMNESVERPWTVALGCAIGLALFVWDIVSSISEQDTSVRIFFLAVAIIPVPFTLAAFFRRNWGRIVLAIIAALGFVSVLLLPLFGDDMAGLFEAEFVIYSIAEIAFIVLLFVPASNAWYRRSREAVI